MDAFGRFIVVMLACAASYFVMREIWDFPLDNPTYWFATGYGLICTTIVKLCK